MRMILDASIIFKGLIPLFQPTANWLGRNIVGGEILERRKLQETALKPVLEKAVEDIAESIEQIGAAELDQICLFLTSNEAEAIIRQIYAVSILQSKEQNLEQISQEFLTAFSLYTNIPKSELRDSAAEIFRILVGGCEEALKIAIDQGKLAAHEAKSLFRYQVLLDEIANVNKNLEFLSTTQQLDISAINTFESKYREQVKVRHGYIIPPYIQEIKKIPIESIYVDSNFYLVQNKSDDLLEENINYKVFYHEIKRTVLLGNPGGGKSTFAQKLIYDLANCYSERLLSARQVTPILVVLRDYGTKKKEQGCSILKMIELTANANYQLQPPNGALEYMLLNGRVAVIFDGLDELTETGYRQEITSDVECFCNLYPSVPVLVTSREVGYKEAPLDESKFTVYRLASFGSEQIEEYVNKWFNIAFDSNTDEKEKSAKAFLKESNIVPDLRSNPLMLGLMCNIYRGENYIPINRPEIYHKCADMMFERWDKSRGIQISSIENIQSQVRPLMMHLADWIYAEESLQLGVTEQKIINKAAEYLYSRRFEDRDEAEVEAHHFINFCCGRAWVFRDTGTTKDGEKLYQFTHRTFLEYFAAAYLDRTHRTPNDLFNFLYPRIAKQEWDMVCQIAFQIKNKNSENAGDDLLELLLKRIKTGEMNTKWNLLIFAVKCLEFIVPSPSIIENIVTTLINECIEFGLSMFDKQDYIPGSTILIRENILLPLSHAAKENTNKIISTIKKSSLEKLEKSNDRELSLMLELISILQSPIFKGSIFEGQSSWSSIFNEFLDTIGNEYPDTIKRITKKNLLICKILKNKEKYSFSEILEWYSFEELFLKNRYKIIPNTSIFSLIYFALHDFLSLDKKQVSAYKVDEIVEFFSKLGNILLSSSINLSIDDSFMSFYFDSETAIPINKMSKINHKEDDKSFYNSIRIINNNNDALFGVCAIFAIYYEITGRDRRSFMNSSFIFDKNVETDEISCNLNQKQRNFIRRWVIGEIDLVSRVNAKKLIAHL